MAILPFVMLACLNPTDWSVDPAGAGDFLSLSAALAAPQVVDGDRLWIAPGDYGDVLVQKAVDLRAPPGQRFRTHKLSIGPVGTLTIQGLTTDSLDLNGCWDRVNLLDIEVGTEGFYIWMPPGVPLVLGGTSITNCRQVLIAGSVLRGTQQCYDYATHPGTCLAISNARVAISGSTLFGGDDLGLFYSECNTHYPTPPTITAVQSELTLSSVIVHGGASGYPSSAAFGSGVALSMVSSNLDARGTGLESWTAGHPGSEVIVGSGQGSLSGIQLSPPGQPAWLRSPSEPLPLLRAPVLAPAGGNFSIELWAPLGEPAAVALSAFPALDPISLSPLGALWLDLNAPMALYLELGAGPGQPATETFSVPSLPALSGLVITLQAFLPPCGTPACLWGGQGSLTPPLAALLQ
jgi:hypothetical protein